MCTLKDIINQFLVTISQYGLQDLCAQTDINYIYGKRSVFLQVIYLSSA